MVNKKINNVPIPIKIELMNVKKEIFKNGKIYYHFDISVNGKREIIGDGAPAESIEKLKPLIAGYILHGIRRMYE